MRVCPKKEQCPGQQQCLGFKLQPLVHFLISQWSHPKILNTFVSSHTNATVNQSNSSRPHKCALKSVNKEESSFIHAINSEATHQLIVIVTLTKLYIKQSQHSLKMPFPLLSNRCVWHPKHHHPCRLLPCWFWWQATVFMPQSKWRHHSQSRFNSARLAKCSWHCYRTLWRRPTTRHE